MIAVVISILSADVKGQGVADFISKITSENKHVANA